MLDRRRSRIYLLDRRRAGSRVPAEIRDSFLVRLKPFTFRENVIRVGRILRKVLIINSTDPISSIGIRDVTDPALPDAVVQKLAFGGGLVFATKIWIPHSWVVKAIDLWI